jgi:hypothetical protein
MSTSTDSSLTLRDVCDLFRSRNAGAFKLTVDIVPESAELFAQLQAAGTLESEEVARRLGVRHEDLQVSYYSQSNAIKLTVPRRVSGGGPDDHDVDGAQQFVTLLDLPAGVDG